MPPRRLHVSPSEAHFIPGGISESWKPRQISPLKSGGSSCGPTREAVPCGPIGEQQMLAELVTQTRLYAASGRITGHHLLRPFTVSSTWKVGQNHADDDITSKPVGPCDQGYCRWLGVCSYHFMSFFVGWTFGSWQDGWDLHVMESHLGMAAGMVCGEGGRGWFLHSNMCCLNCRFKLDPAKAPMQQILQQKSDRMPVCRDALAMFTKGEITTSISLESSNHCNLLCTSSDPITHTQISD